MMFAFIAKETGWTIDEISSLTEDQFSLVVDALSQMKHEESGFRLSLAGAKRKFGSRFTRQYPPVILKEEAPKEAQEKFSRMFRGMNKDTKDVILSHGEKI